MSLKPPAGYDSWLLYAIATMDTRSLFNEHMASENSPWPEGTHRGSFTEAAIAELDTLRREREALLEAANKAASWITWPCRSTTAEQDVAYVLGKAIGLCRGIK